MFFLIEPLKRKVKKDNVAKHFIKLNVIFVIDFVYFLF